MILPRIENRANNLTMSAPTKVFIFMARRGRGGLEQVMQNTFFFSKKVLNLFQRLQNLRGKKFSRGTSFNWICSFPLTHKQQAIVGCFGNVSAEHPGLNFFNYFKNQTPS